MRMVAGEPSPEMETELFLPKAEPGRGQGGEFEQTIGPFLPRAWLQASRAPGLSPWGHPVGSGLEMLHVGCVTASENQRTSTRFHYTASAECMHAPFRRLRLL